MYIFEPIKAGKYLRQQKFSDFSAIMEELWQLANRSVQIPCRYIPLTYTRCHSSRIIALKCENLVTITAAILTLIAELTRYLTTSDSHIKYNIASCLYMLVEYDSCVCQRCHMTDGNALHMNDFNFTEAGFQRICGCSVFIHYVVAFYYNIHYTVSHRYGIPFICPLKNNHFHFYKSPLSERVDSTCYCMQQITLLNGTHTIC